MAEDGLTRLQLLPTAVVDVEVERALLEIVGLVWGAGWQPAELHRQGRRGCATVAGGRLVALAIATDHVGRRSTTLDQRWVAQVEGLDLPAVDGRSGWVRRWTSEEGFDRARAVDVMVDAIANLSVLPRLDAILPPPGSVGDGGRWGAPSPGTTGVEVDPVLERIRNLLAKAESTEFEAEAMAFTAKAQQLMTRHAIDVAMLGRDVHARPAEPIVVRIPVDAPYADAKSLLLQTVAEHGRCRTVFHAGPSLSTVVGFPADVGAVELLFTSLLVQAQTALGAAANRAPAGTRTRSQSYRSAFLLSYADRIGARLAEVNAAVFAEAETESGSAFLPVLRSQAAAVDDFMADRFGDLVASPVRGGYDVAGWVGGAAAADQAQLSFGDLTGEEAQAG